MKLPRRQLLHPAVGGAAIKEVTRCVVRRFLNPTTRATDLVNRSCDYMRTGPSTSTASWSTETRRLQWHKR